MGDRFGQVHTLARKYVNTTNGFVEFTRMSRAVDLKNESVSALLKKEEEFYSWLDCHDFPSFIKKIRQLFADAGDDREVFNQFKKANLDLLLGNDKSITENMHGQTIEIELVNPIESINIKELLGTGCEGPNTSIYFRWTPYSGKYVMNILEKEVFNRDKHNFKIGTSSMTAMRQEIRALIDSKDIQDIFIIDTKNGGRRSIKEAFTPKENSIFGYTEKEIEEAYKNKETWKQLKPELIRRKQEAYNYLMSLCSQASPTFKLAFTRAWENKIGTGISDKEVLNFGFLSTGASRTKLKGNIQELLASAILGEYINLRIGNGVNGKVAKVLGNIIDNGTEQPKTDVQIFNSIGIQVKAYDPEKEFTKSKSGQLEQRLMETKIHPNKLDADLGAFLRGIGVHMNQNIGDYMVQACFNKTNAWTDERFTEAMENALVQLMNLDTGANLSDAICFYLVDVTQLVPASHILESFAEKQPIVSYRAPSTYDGQNDLYYNDEGKDSDASFERSDGSIGPNFLAYYDGGFPLQPTDEAFNVYQDLYTKSISIDVKFDYHFMYNSKYSII